MAVYLRSKSLAKNRKRYYLDIYHNNRRSYEFLFIVEKEDDKAEKKALAESMRSQRAIEIESEGTAYIPKHKKKVKVLKYFENHLKDYNKKDIRLVQSAITKFSDYLNFKNIPTDIIFLDLQEKHFTQFSDYLNNDAGLKGETPHNYWKKFKSIILKATKEKLINSDIYSGVQFKRKSDYSDSVLVKQVLTEEELQTLFNVECGNDEVKRAFLFSCYTGLGYAELKELCWGNIIDDKLVINRKKTGKQISNKISVTAIKLLGERKKSNDLIFDLKNSVGNFITENGANKTLKNWVKRAEIDKHITFYCGRHTFATRLLLNGADLKTVANAMTHSNTTITAKYLNYIDQLKDKATSNLK